MNNRVTVRTNRSQVADGINGVGGRDGCQRAEMVNMDESGGYVSVRQAEVEATDRAHGSV